MERTAVSSAIIREQTNQTGPSTVRVKCIRAEDGSCHRGLLLGSDPTALLLTVCSSVSMLSEL